MTRKDDFLQDGKMHPYFQKVWAHFCFKHIAIIDKQETKETSWSPKQDKPLFTRSMAKTHTVTTAYFIDPSLLSICEFLLLKLFIFCQ